eukprot:3616092-Alexandrium_andersonii.AAC.1
MQCCTCDSVGRFVQHFGHESQDSLCSAAPTRPWTASCSAAAICPRAASCSAAPATPSTASCGTPAT